MRALQTALRVIYPPRCTLCGDQVESDFALCGACWRDTPFITGLVCDLCGTPLLGESSENHAICDDCMRSARPWSTGRAALKYSDNGRALVLALKHGDRHEIVRPAARWLADAAQPILTSDMLVTPIPLHWFRLLRRRYNQSALISQELARLIEHEYCPDLLLRQRYTKTLGGLTHEERFTMLESAIVSNPRHHRRIVDRDILLVDDVMASGATFSAATLACYDAGAARVFILALARATKDA